MASHKKYTFTGIGDSSESIIIEADITKYFNGSNNPKFIFIKFEDSEKSLAISINSLTALEIADTLMSIVEEIQKKT